LLIVRPDEGVFFANAASLRSAIRRRIAASEPPIRTTILNLVMTSELDVPSTEMLAELYEEHEALGIQFELVGIHTPVQKMLDASGLTEKVGPENIYPTVLEAVFAFASEHLDEFTAEDMETVIDRIDNLTEFFQFASDHVGEEHQAKLSDAIDKLEQTRSNLQSG
jgi:MFS superfamily sulfate permease-like transporter